jgi:hypothetical protein
MESCVTCLCVSTERIDLAGAANAVFAACSAPQLSSTPPRSFKARPVWIFLPSQCSGMDFWHIQSLPAIRWTEESTKSLRNLFLDSNKIVTFAILLAGFSLESQMFAHLWSRMPLAICSVPRLRHKPRSALIYSELSSYRWRGWSVDSVSS